MELVDVASIKPDPNQPRKKFDKDAVDNLAKTIHGHKIINPIEIDENSMIITGEMRWRALMKVGTEKTLVKRITEISESKRLERQTIENVHHNNLSDIEFENVIERLMKSGDYETQTHLANTLGCRISKVNEALKGKEIRKETKTHAKITSRDLKKISSLKKKEDREIIVKKMEKKEILPSQVQDVIRTIRTVPKDVKEEILKPKSEITLEEAKEIAEIKKPEMRKEAIKFIKKQKVEQQRTKEYVMKVAKEEIPMPIKIINLDQRAIDQFVDLKRKVIMKMHIRNVESYNEPTQVKLKKEMKDILKFLKLQLKEE